MMLDLETTDHMELSPNSGPPLYCFDVNERTVLLKSVPVFVTRNEIKHQIDSIAELKGHLEFISFSEPLKSFNFERFAWLTFDSEEASL